MVEIKITNETLAGALGEMAGMAARIGGTPGTPTPARPAPVAAPTVQAPAPVPPTVPVAPAPVTAGSVPTVPVSRPVSPPAAPITVPTAPAPRLTLEQVGKAGATMIAADPATLPSLHALLQQFGVSAISQLVPEQIGPFATALRGLGAKI